MEHNSALVYNRTIQFIPYGPEFFLYKLSGKSFLFYFFFSLYSEGVIPVTFLKHLLKYFGSLKPVI